MNDAEVTKHSSDMLYKRCSIINIDCTKKPSDRNDFDSFNMDDEFEMSPSTFDCSINKDLEE